jgi:hypothetical protein|tara:strand:+ start:580 stop:936 length:357 start_codon:yes stop_codon:yes gene_type:complete
MKWLVIALAVLLFGTGAVFAADWVKVGDNWQKTDTVVSVSEFDEVSVYNNKEDYKSKQDLINRIQCANLTSADANDLKNIAHGLDHGKTIAEQKTQMDAIVLEIPTVADPNIEEIVME